MSKSVATDEQGLEGAWFASHVADEKLPTAAFAQQHDLGGRSETQGAQPSRSRKPLIKADTLSFCSMCGKWPACATGSKTPFAKALA